MNLREYTSKSDNYIWGKVFILSNKQFGTHIFLCSKYPRKEFTEKTIFIGLNTQWADTYFYSSVENDEVLKVFNSLKEYIEFTFTLENNKENK